MKVVSDLHLHSRHSRAVSSQMVPQVMWKWANRKGIDLLATGDWTHPLWLKELESSLVEYKQGVYQLKKELKDKDGAEQIADKDAKFLLSTELSCIYGSGGKIRRIHLIVFAPNFSLARMIAKQLLARGVKLASDGRPVMGLSARHLLELILETDDRFLVIPAHVWTPWFSLYGSQSGFDSLEECFGDVSRYVYAVETGLSSDPAMNWGVDDIKNRKIVSFSDAHSPLKLGREATVFDLEELDYASLHKAIVGQDKKNRILGTIEFYPQEGKYHYTGHRKCGVVYSPKDEKEKGVICPVCGKGLTVGVESRVNFISARKEKAVPSIDEFGTRWLKHKGGRPAYVMLVPLHEILSEVLKAGTGTKQVQSLYEQLVNNFESEFNVLLKTGIEDIARIAGERVGQAVSKMRRGDIFIDPGYDGLFGKVKIWPEDSQDTDTSNQPSLF